VVTDIPANQQLVESEKHGLLPPAGDVRATAAALMRLLDDRELRGRMGAEARRSVQDKYAIEQVLERYEALLGETVRTPRPVATVSHS
jgi:glycosyltransferase involved in cell wall biosynthesis